MSDPATIFTWSVDTLERQTANGIVYNIHYRIDANDGTYSSGAYGSIGLEAPAEGDEVVPYAELTEETVIGWTKTALGGDEKVTEIETALQGQITEQRTPTRGTGTPWT